MSPQVDFYEPAKRPIFRRRFQISLWLTWDIVLRFKYDVRRSHSLYWNFICSDFFLAELSQEAIVLSIQQDKGNCGEGGTDLLETSTLTLQVVNNFERFKSWT